MDQEARKQAAAAAKELGIKKQKYKAKRAIWLGSGEVARVGASVRAGWTANGEVLQSQCLDKVATECSCALQVESCFQKRQTRLVRLQSHREKVYPNVDVAPVDPLVVAGPQRSSKIFILSFDRTVNTRYKKELTEHEEQFVAHECLQLPPQTVTLSKDPRDFPFGTMFRDALQKALKFEDTRVNFLWIFGLLHTELMGNSGYWAT